MIVKLQVSSSTRQEAPDPGWSQHSQHCSGLRLQLARGRVWKFGINFTGSSGAGGGSAVIYRGWGAVACHYYIMFCCGLGTGLEMLQIAAADNSVFSLTFDNPSRICETFVCHIANFCASEVPIAPIIYLFCKGLQQRTEEDQRVQQNAQFWVSRSCCHLAVWWRCGATHRKCRFLLVTPPRAPRAAAREVARTNMEHLSARGDHTRSRTILSNTILETYCLWACLSNITPQPYDYDGFQMSIGFWLFCLLLTTCECGQAWPWHDSKI